jgi:hypothetical protein
MPHDCAVAVDKSQLGRAGELALSLYALITSRGELELFSPVVDDDHVDLVGSLRGGLPRLALQVKTADSVDRNGLVEARASYPLGAVREDPAFLYAVLLLESVQIRALWLIPSPDFNRLVYRDAVGGRDVLEFRASPTGDGVFSAFLVSPLSVGPTLVARMSASDPPAWIRELGASSERAP